KTCICSKVHQSPSDLIKSRGDSVELYCQHNISSYNVILWYKSRVEQELTLLGNLVMSTDSYVPAFKDKNIIIKGNAIKDGTLTIKDLSVKDNAVYFCASLYNLITHQSELEKQNYP
uniref:Ig-like domain-containing protein n=1 Tax=Astyanax mexicanus TaxID=7994 RepID=A0A8B9RJ11_ASTMX